MADVETTLTHNGTPYAATIVTVERTELGREDHGVWLAHLHVKWGGCGTAIGGHVLDGKPEDRYGDRPGTAYGMQYIISLVETVAGKYGKWEDLKGKQVFMLHENGSGRFDRAGFNCKGVASLDGERVMIFADVFTEETE